MRFIDSNLLIYAAHEEYKFLRPLIGDDQTCLSVASKIETLGYHKLSEMERTFFEGIFRAAIVLAIDDVIIDKAVELRRIKKMSFGDCIIAATALVHHLDLYTNNTADFSHIPELTVINPLVEN